MRTAVVLASAACLLLACSGKILEGGSGGGGGGSSGGGSSGASGGGSGSASGGGGTCVDIELSSYDVSCTTASDCVSIAAGEICTGTCTCGGAAINADGQARYEQAISGVALGTCFCPEIPAPQCIAGVCSAGTTTATVDASTTTTTVDAAACVDVDVSTYSESCSVDTDCLMVTSGKLCTGECACGGSVISASEQSRYDQATQGIQIAECPCAYDGTPRCLGGTCALCGFGPNQPSGCPDAG